MDVERIINEIEQLQEMFEAPDIEKAQRLKPDLIVLDLSMPVMNGLEAAPLLIRAVPSVRIILFTAHDGAEVTRLARAAGIHAIIAKSQAPTELIERARALLMAA
jgi:two-component system, NarL family, nitrate/nitrite response regulator NarL